MIIIQNDPDQSRAQKKRDIYLYIFLNDISETYVNIK